MAEQLQPDYELARQLGFLQAGGLPQGQRDVDKANVLAQTIGSIPQEYNTIISQVLANKKQKLEQRRVGEVFGIPTAEAAQGQQSAMVQPNIFPQPQAQGPVTQQGVAPQSAAMPGPAPVAPGVQSRSNFLNETGITADVPVFQVKELLPELLMKQKLNQPTDMLPISTLPLDIRQRLIDSGFDPEGMINLKKYNAVNKVDPSRKVSAMTPQQRLDAGKAPKDTIIVNPTTQGDENREARINKAILDYSEKLENNYMIKQLNSQAIGLDTANELDALASQGNTVSASALGIKQAKGLGEVGVMTEQDISRYTASGKLSQKGSDILKKWMTGSPTDATLNEILEVNNVMKDIMKTKVQPIYNRYINRLSANYGLTKEDAARRLDVSYFPEAGNSQFQETVKPQEQSSALNSQIQSQLPQGAKIKSIKRIP